ncbi:hypothetical protein [Pedobacter hiemivivus]|uniref:Uncharacterized protein n=1 Tax=Pedobacter hiemivivus TaxID=2530454 RepID=A0A4R0MJE5_9SPHI|nr:hypothetical protein [Pedobacter hiemivivus]TCC86367.1 hypothetical protein EZ444_23995 [Pedobacter hiemivivus]
MSKLTKEQHELSESDIKAKSDWKGGMDWAKEQAAEQATKEATRRTLFNVASKLKAIGCPSDEIAEVTGLLIEEIEKLPSI